MGRAWCLTRALLLVGLTSGTVRADMLCLVDGRVFEGPPLEHSEPGIVVRFENGDVLVPHDLVQVALIENQPDPEPRSEEEREQVAKGRVLFEGKWIARKRRDQILERRLKEQRELVAERLAHREWGNRRRDQSKNFRFEHTLPVPVFEDYRDRMEAYYKIFAKEWRTSPPEQGKLLVCFYANRAEFNRTSGAGGGTLAYFKYGGERYELNLFYDRLDPTLTEQVLYHEANHYLQKLINEDFHYPHWPGEALAEYYGASRWDPVRKELEVGLVQEGRLAEIQDDMARGQPVSILELLRERRYEDYTWGWSLVHFLMNDARYQKKFRRFFVALAKGRGVRRSPGPAGLRTVGPDAMVEAFRDHLGLKSEADLGDLQAEWQRYIEEELLTGLSTRGLEKAALAAMKTGRPIRARRLFSEALEAGSVDALVHHRYAKLLSKEDRAGAIRVWRRAIELAPLTGTYYLALGKALARDDPAEGKRLQRLGLEIDPEADEQD